MDLWENVLPFLLIYVKPDPRICSVVPPQFLRLLSFSPVDCDGQESDSLGLGHHPLFLGSRSDQTQHDPVSQLPHGVPSTSMEDTTCLNQYTSSATRLILTWTLSRFAKPGQQPVQ